MYPVKLKREKFYSHSADHAFKGTDNIVDNFVMKDYSIGMHQQGFFEINIVLKGNGMHYIENSRIEAKKGDVFVIPPHIAHGYMGGNGFDVCHILLHNKFMEKYMADLQILPSFFVLFNAEPLIRSESSEALHLNISGEEFENTISILCELDKQRGKNTSFSCVTTNSLAMMLIAYLCKIYTANAEEMTEDVPHDTAFLNALALIHEHYDEKISIERLAKTAHLSRSAFIRRFNETCKMPPAKYINHTRIEAAKHMLGNTALSVDEIANKTGFYDAAHFTKTFVAEVGCTPNVYRKEK